jgi:hypothetical protein
MTVRQLARAFAEQRLSPKAEVEAGRAVIEFDGAADVLYVSLKPGDKHVLRAELSPNRLSDRIIVALDQAGYDYVDEDDPRWDKEFA